MSEQVDKKQLKIKKFKNGIKGELYKGVSWGSSTFQDLPPYDNEDRFWSGLEFRYPKEDQITDWSTVYDFIDFVMNSDRKTFENDIWTKVDKENFSTYFLYLNLIRATDNTGKNVYLSKYDKGERYIYSPWDLDGCFGTIYDGSRQDITDDIRTNGLYKRLLDENPNNYKEYLDELWTTLRKGAFSDEALFGRIDVAHNLLMRNGVYQREHIVYPEYSYDSTGITYTYKWLHHRLEFMDNYFKNGKKVDSTKGLNVYPNPATTELSIGNLDTRTPKTFVVYSIQGKEVMRGALNNNYIPVQNLSGGVYILSIEGTQFRFIVAN